MARGRWQQRGPRHSCCEEQLRERKALGGGQPLNTQLLFHLIPLTTLSSFCSNKEKLAKHRSQGVKLYL